MAVNKLREICRFDTGIKKLLFLTSLILFAVVLFSTTANNKVEEGQLNCLENAKTQSQIQKCYDFVSEHPEWFQHKWLNSGFHTADIAAMGYKPILVHSNPLLKELGGVISFWKNHKGNLFICRTVYSPNGPELVALPNEQCFMDAPDKTRLVKTPSESERTKAP